MLTFSHVQWFIMCLYIFDTCHPFIKTSFVTFSWIKRQSWDNMHFTCHNKVNDDMKFHYHKKILKSWPFEQLGFASKCPLRLNEWNEMGLTIHQSLVAYVLLYEYVVVKANCKTQNVLLCIGI
jgi:hypothetical protein